MTWKKILSVLPNRELLLEQYESDTLPSQARWFPGSPNYGNRDFHNKDSFDDMQILQARTAKMIAQICAAEVKYYDVMIPKDIGELKVHERERLEKLMQN